MGEMSHEGSPGTGSRGCNHRFSSHPGYHEPEFMEAEEARATDIMDTAYSCEYYDEYSSEEYDYVGED